MSPRLAIRCRCSALCQSCDPFLSRSAPFDCVTGGALFPDGPRYRGQSPFHRPNSTSINQALSGKRRLTQRTVRPEGQPAARSTSADRPPGMVPVRPKPIACSGGQLHHAVVSVSPGSSERHRRFSSGIFGLERTERAWTRVREKYRDGRLA